MSAGGGHEHSAEKGGGEKKGLAAAIEYLNPFKIASKLVKIVNREGVQDFLRSMTEYPIGFFTGVSLVIPGLFGAEGGGHGASHGKSHDSHKKPH